MSAILELSPSAGTTSPSASSIRKIATNASACGNIWMISRPGEARAAAREAEARERVGGGGAHEHRADGGDGRRSMSVLPTQVQ